MLTRNEHAALRLFQAEAETETGRPTRTFTLWEAARIPPLPGLYVLLRGGRPIYAGQAGNLRERMLQYRRMVILLACGKLNEYTARLTFLKDAGEARRLVQEGKLIRRVNTLLHARKLPRLKNVQGREQKEWAW